MRKLRLVIGIAAALTVVQPASQAFAAYTIVPDSIYKHIAVLSSDSLEGREVGEPGERKAARYIIDEFQSAGLQPRGDSGQYLQAFEFVKRISFGPKNHLAINGQNLKLNDDYIPLEQSASLPFSFSQIVSVGYGIKTEDSSVNDYSGKEVAGKAVD